MKISRIEIANVLGLARADIDLPTPILLVAGSNEAGKSTLADAISMALLGQPRRVKLKKDMVQLLHDGSQKGRVTLLDENGDTAGMIRLPKGEFTQPPAFPGIEFTTFLVSPSAFAALSLDERRTVLFALTRCKMNPDQVEAELVNRGVLPEIAAELKPLLRGGFPDTAKLCAERATQAKGAWRQITGMNWGSVQAAQWQPEEVRAVSDREVDTAQAEVVRCQQAVDNASREYAVIDQAQKEAAGLHARISQLEELAGTLQRATAKLAATQGDLLVWRAKKTATAEKIKVLAEGRPSVACPCCSELLMIVGDGLARFMGVEADPAALAQLRTEHAKAVEAVALLERTEKNDLAAIQAANDATAQVGLLQAQIQEKEGQSSWAEAAQALSTAKDELACAQVELRALLAAKEAASGAARRKVAADENNQAVNAWLLTAEALSPSGIPAMILESALSPVNDSLAALARLSGWKLVAISPDMEITIGGRLYGLVSESAKWRADCLIALAIAQISQAKFVVLDRFDVLDQAGRGQLLRLLKSLAKMGSMETMIMAGTLKALPDSSALGPLITPVWVENAIAETSSK